MKDRVRGRLLRVGRDLFYRRGYYKTGVREITREARAALASFYDHFESKEGLALAYLLEEEREMRENLTKLMAAYPRPEQFFRAWIIAKKKDIRDGRFIGCPFAGFAYQSGELEDEHRESVSKIQRRWEGLLQDYIRAAAEAGYLNKDTDPRALARRIMLLYQGGVAGWRISNNRAYIEEMQAAIVEAIEKHSA